MNAANLCGAALLPIALAFQARGAAERPNIVFIMSDDHAAQAIGANSPSCASRLAIPRRRSSAGFRT